MGTAHPPSARLLIPAVLAAFALVLAAARTTHAALAGGEYRVAEGALVEACGGFFYRCETWKLEGRLELTVTSDEASIAASSLTLSTPAGPPFAFPATFDLQLTELSGELTTHQLVLTSPPGSIQTVRLTLRELGADLVLDGTYDEGCCDRFVLELTRIHLVSEAAVIGRHALRWQDRFGAGLGDTFRRPDASGTSIPNLAPVPYHALSVFVEESGVYEITSDQNVLEPFDGMLLLYGPGFDPDDSLHDLLAVNDDAGPYVSRIVAPLSAGVIYRVVTTFVSPASIELGLVDIDNQIRGPGRIHFSACFLDEPLRFDDNSDLSLLNERFCARVQWDDGRGGSGIARPVGLRANESGLFWFFDADNWELQIKILDGCAVNGHYWLLLAGSTDVGFSLEVRDLLGGNAPYAYHNPPDTAAGSFFDTGTLLCN